MSAIPACSGIYRIVCEANGKVYVGSAVNLRKRWECHLFALGRGKHHNAHLQAAWNKYGGLGAFHFETVELVPKELLLDAEQRHIDECPDGFNICKKAGSLLGTKRSYESKAKMSVAAKRRCASAEGRAALDSARRATAASPAARAKIAAAAKRQMARPEFKAMMLATHLGKPVSAETRAKMRAASAKRTHSPETRAKISAAHTGRVRSAEARASMSAAQNRSWATRRSLAKAASK